MLRVANNVFSKLTVRPAIVLHVSPRRTLFDFPTHTAPVEEDARPAAAPTPVCRDAGALQETIAKACSASTSHKDKTWLFKNLLKDLEASLHNSWAFSKYMPGIKAAVGRTEYDMADIKALRSKDMNMILHANRWNWQEVQKWHTLLSSTDKCNIRPDNYTFPILITAHLHRHKRDFAGAIRLLDLMHDQFLQGAQEAQEQESRSAASASASAAPPPAPPAAPPMPPAAPARSSRNASGQKKLNGKQRAALSVAANSILMAHARESTHSQQGIGIEKFLRRMTSVYKVVPNIRTLTIVVNSYGRRGDLASACRWFASIRNKYGLKPDYEAYSALLRAYAEAGSFSGAWKALDDMKNEGIKADLKAHNIVMYATKKGNNLTAAISLYDSMIRDKIKPDEYTFSCLINAYASVGRVQEAMELFEKMQDSGLAPEHSCAAGVLNALAFSGDVDGSIAFMLRIQNECGMQVNTIYVNILLKALCRSTRVGNTTDKQRIAIAIKIWDKYLSPGTIPYTNQTYYYLILACKSNVNDGSAGEESIKMTEFWFNQMLVNKPRVEPEASVLDLVEGILGKERFATKMQQIMGEEQVLQSLDDLERDIAL